jgi:hypothetical protein
MIEEIRKIGILGGTGALGSALTKKWAIAGYEILIGSRDPVKAQKIATQVNSELNVSNIQGLDSKAAARESDISVLTVPYSSHADTLNLVKEDLKGKILIDTTVPLQKMVTKVQLPAIGSAAMEAQIILGTEVEVVAALQNIGSHLVGSEDTISAEVLVTANNKGSAETVMSLLSCLGLKCWYAGGLENSAAAEALTSVLIVINKNYKLKSSGIKITSH